MRDRTPKGNLATPLHSPPSPQVPQPDKLAQPQCTVMLDDAGKLARKPTLHQVDKVGSGIGKTKSPRERGRERGSTSEDVNRRGEGEAGL